MRMRRGFTALSANKDVDLVPKATVPHAAAEILMNRRRVVFIFRDTVLSFRAIYQFSYNHSMIIDRASTAHPILAACCSRWRFAETPYNSRDDATGGYQIDRREHSRIVVADFCITWRHGKRIINDANARHSIFGRKAAGDRPRHVGSVRCRAYAGQGKATRRCALTVRETRRSRGRLVADVWTFRGSDRYIGDKARSTR